MAYIDVGKKPLTRKPLQGLPVKRTLTSKDKSVNLTVQLERILPENRQTCSRTQRILTALRDLLNYEIVERGDSYPFPSSAPLNDEQFIAYYASAELFVATLQAINGRPVTDETTPRNTYVSPSTGNRYDFDNSVLGSFYIKPNYPHRSAHICNGGFLVVPAYQKDFGIGTFMGREFVLLAADLGYKGSMFNLVYSTNVGSIAVWKKLGFTHLSTIPECGLVVVRDANGVPLPEEKYVDALQFYCNVQQKAREWRSKL
jgi:ribosomal protein S18 acetylase RimI-like enzyme